MTGYLLQVDHRVFERRGGGGFSLPEAVRELHGTGNARILRASDLSVVVDRAGNDETGPVHAPTGRSWPALRRHR